MREIKGLKPKFYLRVIGPAWILFPQWVNKCLVFNGFKRPYVCNATDIRGDLSFLEFKI
jgi:hypothetical protein